MGVYDVIRRGFIEALTGYREEDIKSLCIRAQTMADLAMKGKYRDSLIATMVVGNVRIIDRLTTLLGYPRRKSSVPKVAIVQWGGDGRARNAPDPPVAEARPISLLAKIAGSSVGAQLDIKRECLPSDCTVEELQREKQVLNMVPPDCLERVQPNPSIQTG